MSENTELQTVDLNNFKPISVLTHTVLMLLYRSVSKIKGTFEFHFSEFGFNHKQGGYKPLEREFELNEGTQLDGFTNPENESGQAVAALDAMMRSLFDVKDSERIDWYQIDGNAKTISAFITDGSRYGVRTISNVEQVAGGLTFDKITEADNTDNDGNGLLVMMRDACFANLAARDATDYPALIKAENERRTAQGA